MDPVTAGLNLLTSVNNVINTLVAKTSSPVADALVQDYLARQARIETFLTALAGKIGIQLPAPPPVPNPAAGAATH